MKRLIILFASLFCLLTALPAEADGSIVDGISCSVAYSAAELKSGTLEARIYINDRNDEAKAGLLRDFIVGIGFYNGDGVMLDFDAATLSTEYSESQSMYSGKEELSLEIPEDFGDDCYVQAVAMTAETLEPVPGRREKLKRDLPPTDPHVTYTGLFERYYTLDSPQGSVTVGEYMSQMLIASAKGTPFCLRDIGDGLCLIEDYKNHDFLSFSGGLFLGSNADSAYWHITRTDNGYCFDVAGAYLALKDGVACVSDEPFEFTLTLVGETPFSLITALPGYELLTSDQRQRVEQIATSPGSNIFPYTFYTLSESLRISFNNIYYGRDRLTAQQQRDRILSAVGVYVFYSLNYFDDLAPLPGGGADITRGQAAMVSAYFPDIGRAECYRIPVTYNDGYTSQLIYVYCLDPNYGNVSASIEALAAFPYGYRKELTGMYVYQSSAGVYSCNGDELFVRLPYTVSTDDVKYGFAHELGHSLDMMADGAPYIYDGDWSQNGTWRAAMDADIISVSAYGDNSNYEDLAEFCRLYFLCYGDPQLQNAIKQLFPNRFSSFAALLNKHSLDTLY